MRFASTTCFSIGLILILYLFCSNISKPGTTITSLRFLDEYDVPYNATFNNTTIGGLSGIDYDQENHIYYLLSDDRSAINPVRFYTAKIRVLNNKIDTVEFSGVNYLLMSDGQPYPSPKHDPPHATDPEAIRYNSQTKQLVWTSEGERNVKSQRAVLINPAINIATTDGKSAGELPVPKNFEMQSTERGPRQNGTLEGITFGETFNTVYVAMEEPLFEDGPRAEVTNTNSFVRFLKYDFASKKNTAQYAYAVDPVVRPAIPVDAFKVNGVSEILWLGNNKLLTLERSYSVGHEGCTIKIFIADLNPADNIISVSSFKENPPTHLVKKKLLLNMDELGIYIDNIEGVTFGPDLPNGHKTLLFVSDNNFQEKLNTQFMLFEIIP